MGLFYAAPKSAPIKSATKTARLFISMGEKSRLVLPRRFQCISSIYIKMAKLKRSLLLACVAEQLHLEDTLINLCVAQLKSKKRPRYWVHDIIKNRKIHGAYYHLVRELELDTNRYKEYFRMSPQQLEMVLSFVGPMIQKRAVVTEPTHNTARLKSRALGGKNDFSVILSARDIHCVAYCVRHGKGNIQNIVSGFQRLVCG
ncbi:nuclease HARBI1 [Elysia marginata]|uniref:Nuclease HARBI1 n=1 Tax=Elysia marginata TaxID=1093978 RepID=A0AAV4GAV5_9GAST|nr:nuclease HARBI1 [Elysia marginata]